MNPSNDTTGERFLLSRAAFACHEAVANYIDRPAAGQPPVTAPPADMPSTAEIERELRAAVIGQDHVAGAVARTIAIRAAGIDLRPERPLGVFLFTGPTGVGKTEMASAISKALTRRDGRLLRIDCSEYSEAHQIARLIGAPPGYVGFAADSPVEEFLREGPDGVLLFDEFEKADPALHRLCLQIFDAGRLTTSGGKTLLLSGTCMVATTNFSVRNRHPLGFVGQPRPNESTRDDMISPPAPMKELRQSFAAELLNRFDAILPFRPINPEGARRIVRERLLPAAEQRLKRAHGIGLIVRQDVEDLVVETGFSEEFGARHVQRAFSILVLNPVAEALAALPRDCRGLVVYIEKGDIRARPAQKGEWNS